MSKTVDIKAIPWRKLLGRSTHICVIGFVPKYRLVSLFNNMPLMYIDQTIFYVEFVILSKFDIPLDRMTSSLG